MMGVRRGRPRFTTISAVLVAVTTCMLIAVPNAHAGGNKPVKLRGGSGENIGCIPCDGMHRFLIFDEKGLTVGAPNTPAEEDAQGELAESGTIDRFRVKISEVEGGQWEFYLRINGENTAIACNVLPDARKCSSDGEIQVEKGDLATIMIGNPGSPFTQGEVRVRWSLRLSPS